MYIIPVSRLLNEDDGFINMISNHSEKNNMIYFNVRYINDQEVVCGPVRKNSMEHYKVLEKKDRIRRRVSDKYKSKYETVQNSLGKMKFYKIKKEKQKIKRQNSLKMIGAIGLTVALGITSVVTINEISAEDKKTILNNIKTFTQNIGAKVDGIVSSDIMDDSEVLNYYTELLRQDPNNKAAQNYINSRMQNDRQKHIEQVQEEERKMFR